MERELANHIKAGDTIQVYGYGESDPVVIPPQSARVEEVRFPFFVVTLAGQRRMVPFRLAEAHMISEADPASSTVAADRHSDRRVRRMTELCRLWHVACG